MKKLTTTIILSALTMGLACIEEPPELRLVLFDGSGSSPRGQNLLVSVAEGWLEEDRTGGDRLEVYLVGQDLAAATRLHAVTVPRHWGSPVRAKKDQWRRRELRRLDEMLRELSCPRGCGSGVVSGLWSAVERLRAAPATFRKTLTVLSDLREWSAVGRLDRGRPLPEPQAFLKRVKAQGLLSDLKGLSLRICGVHSQSVPGSPWRATDSVRLQAVWRAFFKAAGQPQVVFHTDCPAEEVRR